MGSVYCFIPNKSINQSCPPTLEILAYKAYRSPDLPVAFWRTSTGQEVDFILGDKEVAIEVKGGARVHAGDLAALNAIAEDGPVKKKIVVCLEPEPRKFAAGIRVVPWHLFLDELWAGHLA